MDTSIRQYIKRNITCSLVKERLETIKTTIGNAYPDSDSIETIEVKGRDLISGIPKILTIDSEEILSGHFRAD